MLKLFPQVALLLMLFFSLLVHGQNSAGKYSAVPQYLRLEKGSQLTVDKFTTWLAQNYKLPAGNGFKLLSTEKDQLGMVHYRYQQTIHGMAIEGTMYMLHTRNGFIESISGDVIDKQPTTVAAVLTPQAAINAALNFVNAGEYKWQSAAAEEALKENTNNPNATYYPQPELVYIAQGNQLSSGRFNLAYKMDVYATKPFSRRYIYVDAVSGEILYTKNRIHHVDVNATATTQYSGTQTIVTDSYTGGYRLREAGRGNGIRTYNAQNSTNPANTDFTNATTTWNNVNADLDEYATDAHYASEMAYDFFYTNFSRNSLDDNGMILAAYVHYDEDYDNAFWDGGSMNYGDGNPVNGTTPYTTLDIGGHEIVHGLTQFTADLNYEYESGALNESFSDIFGVAIEQYADQATTIDYNIGNDNGNSFRSLRNPKTYGQPDTYLGIYWYAGTQDDGGVHTNSGVQNHWFYVLAQGEVGSNDNSQTYNVTGIGIDKAQSIAYRTLTVYLSPNSQYADARFFSIKAAEDIFGVCSPEVKAVTDAWHAVGVGAKFVQAVTTNFGAPVVSSCAVPATIAFNDSSTNAEIYNWDFGDGTTSFAQNPTHTYTSYGTYTVRLVSFSSNCGRDSLVRDQYISINDYSPSASGTTVCLGSSAVLNASGSGNINWYETQAGSIPVHNGGTFSTPALNQSTTYFVENLIPGPAGAAGPQDKSFGPGSINNSDHYMVFNNTKPQTLVSVLVNSTSAGNRTIQLRDASNNILQTKTVNLATGDQTVTLNFPLPVGNGLRLGIWTGTASLYRNSDGATYPYVSTDGSLSITTNDVGDQDRYYFFYNWQLQQEACISERIPVTVTVGCTGINDEPTWADINLLPNPATIQLQVLLNTNVAGTGNIAIRNILGETLLTKTMQMSSTGNTWKFDVSAFAPGVYLFTLQNGNNSITRRFVKN